MFGLKRLKDAGLVIRKRFVSIVVCRRKLWAGIGIFLSTSVLLGCCLLGTFSGEYRQQIVITPLSIEEQIVFRGASVDGIWFSPNDILLSSGGWIENTEEKTYTSTGQEPFVIYLSNGTQVDLVFNAGPNYGGAEVRTESEAFQLDFHQDDEAILGLPYSLPVSSVTGVSNAFYNRNGAVGLLLLSILAVFITCFFYQGSSAQRKGTNRNLSIEALRFYIIMCVCMHHFCGKPPAGYLGVDFFFVLSGFLLMQKFKQTQTSEISVPAVAAVKYTFGRYLKILPTYLVAFFVVVVLSICLHRAVTLPQILESGVWELLMVEAFGLTQNLLVGPGWYCSALLIAGYFVYLLLYRFEKTYLYCIAPVSLMLVFSYMIQNIGNLNRWLQVDTFISTGALRGFAELGLGCICYQLYLSFHETLRGKYTILRGYLEVACLGYITYCIFVIGPSLSDFVCVLAIAVLLFSLFVGNSWFARVLDNPISAYLGKISMAIFLCHIPLTLVDWAGLIPLPWHYAFAIYLVVVVVFSGIVTASVDTVTTWRKNRA